MITVIKNGFVNKKREYIYDVTFEICGCNFTAEEEDFFWKIVGHGCREKVWKYPCCKNMIRTGQGGNAYVKLFLKE